MRSAKFIWIYFWVVLCVCFFCVFTKIAIDVSDMFIGFTGLSICCAIVFVVYLKKTKYSKYGTIDGLFAFVCFFGVILSGVFIWLEGFMGGRIDWFSADIPPEILYITFILFVSIYSILFQVNFTVPEGFVVSFGATILFPGDKFVFNPFVNPNLLRDTNSVFLEFEDYSFKCKDGKYLCNWSIEFLIKKVSPNDVFSVSEYYGEVNNFKKWYELELEKLAEQLVFSDFVKKEVDMEFYLGKLCFQIIENRQMTFLVEEPHEPPPMEPAD